MTQGDDEFELKYLSVTKDLALKALRGKQCKVYLFGSRARGDASRWSDYDIAISGLGADDFAQFKRAFLEELEESVVPHGADIVDLDSASERFRSEVMKDAIEWTSDSATN